MKSHCSLMPACPPTISLMPVAASIRANSSLRSLVGAAPGMFVDSRNVSSLRMTFRVTTIGSTTFKRFRAGVAHRSCSSNFSSFRMRSALRAGGMLIIVFPFLLHGCARPDSMIAGRVCELLSSQGCLRLGCSFRMFFIFFAVRDLFIGCELTRFPTQPLAYPAPHDPLLVVVR